MKHRSFILCLLPLVCLFVWAPDHPRAAEKLTFPTKPINVIVPQSPGGSIDMEPRGFIPYLKKYLGVDVTIENMPGAGGKMGLTRVWKAKPDGYTLLYHGIPQSIMNEYLFTTEFKTSEFAHILGLCVTNMVLVVHPDHWKTMEEFVKAAKEKTLSAGIPSPGSTSHICGLVMADKLGIKVNWVPFDGSGEVLSGLAGKHLDFGIVSTNSAQILASAEKVRPLMVFSDVTDGVFPKVLFSGETAYSISTMSAIRGFVAPPKTPPEFVKILENAMQKAATDPIFAEWAKSRKLEINALPAGKYLAGTRTQYELLEKYKALFKSS